MAKTSDAAAQIGGAQAVRRAVTVLRAVAMTQRRGATLATLSRMTRLSRTTTFRLLHSLSEEGLLAYNSASHTYTLGRLAYELGLAASGQAELVSRWRERLEKLRALTQMTTYLVARSDLEIVCLSALHGTGMVRAVPLDVGDRLPLGVGGGSLAILASLDDQEVAATIEANLSRFPVYGGGRLTVDEILRRVEAARAEGYAVSKNSTAQGVVGIGMVVPADADLTQLAVSISIPRSDLSKAEVARLVDMMRQCLD